MGSKARARSPFSFLVVPGSGDPRASLKCRQHHPFFLNGNAHTGHRTRTRPEQGGRLRKGLQPGKVRLGLGLLAATSCSVRLPLPQIYPHREVPTCPPQRHGLEWLFLVLTPPVGGLSVMQSGLKRRHMPSLQIKRQGSSAQGLCQGCVQTSSQSWATTETRGQQERGHGVGWGGVSAHLHRSPLESQTANAAQEPARWFRTPPDSPAQWKCVDRM